MASRPAILRYARWIRGLAITCLILSATSLGAGLLRANLLNEIAAGLHGPLDGVGGLRGAAALRYQLVSRIDLGVALALHAAFLVWLHAAVANLRVLGSTAPVGGPGMAVAWFFIPVANLWKPFQTLSRLWRASREPDAWSHAPVSPLVAIWWLTFLASALFGRAGFRFGWRPVSVEQELLGVGLDMAGDLLEAGAVMALWILAVRITGLQSSRRRLALKG